MTEQQTESKALTPRGQMLTTLNQRLGELEPKLAQLLPRFMPAKRFFMIAYDSVTRTPALQECTIPSILKCVIEAAEIGLEVGGPKKHAYLVPFRNKNTGKREAQLIPGYIGLAHLCYDAGGVTKIEPHKVHARDHYVPPGGPDSPFEHFPYNEKCATCGGAAEVTRVTKVKDKPDTRTVMECSDCAGTGRESRGRIIAYYTVATLPNGAMTSCHMDRSQIQSIRGRSKAKDSGPWVTDFDEMAIKTVFKRHEKFLPKTDGEGYQRLARAIELDNQAVGLEDENAGAVETTSRPLPHEILDEDDTANASCPHDVPLDQKCQKCEEEKAAKAKETQKATEVKAGVSSPETAPASGNQGEASPPKTSPDPAPASREPGDESENDPGSDFKTSAEKAAAEQAEPINPQRVGLLAQTAASAGLDEMGISEILKPFGVTAFEQVTNAMFSDVLGRFAKLPPKGKKK